MMNVPIIGRIYHVVDKTTGEIVKVGSTIQSLQNRFNGADYRKKYKNHFLKEFYTIESSEFDWYDKKDPFCPFLWHLLAAEHLEILRANTFRKGPLSNKRYPLDQKFFGFDGSIAGKIGGAISGKITGKISGRKHVESGHLARLRTPEHQRIAGVASGKLSVQNKTGINNPNFDRVKAARLGGLKNVESGHLQRISSKGGKVSGAIQGRKNAESGRMSKIGKSIPLEDRIRHSKIGGPIGMHIRWHVNRGIISDFCKICKAEQSVHTSTNDSMGSNIY